MSRIHVVRKVLTALIFKNDNYWQSHGCQWYCRRKISSIGRQRQQASRCCTGGSLVPNNLRCEQQHKSICVCVPVSPAILYQSCGGLCGRLRISRLCSDRAERRQGGSCVGSLVFCQGTGGGGGGGKVGVYRPPVCVALPF